MVVRDDIFWNPCRWLSSYQSRYWWLRCGRYPGYTIGAVYVRAVKGLITCGVSHIQPRVTPMNIPLQTNPSPLMVSILLVCRGMELAVSAQVREWQGRYAYPTSRIGNVWAYRYAFFSCALGSVGSVEGVERPGSSIWILLNRFRVTMTWHRGHHNQGWWTSYVQCLEKNWPENDVRKWSVAEDYR